jgi:hypothetical protein
MGKKARWLEEGVQRKERKKEGKNESNIRNGMDERMKGYEKRGQSILIQPLFDEDQWHNPYIQEDEN